jgi:hypothetical protein
MSATKMLPRLFGPIRSAIVALATVKSRLLVIPRAPSPQVVQLIPKLKDPVHGEFVNPRANAFSPRVNEAL